MAIHNTEEQIAAVAKEIMIQMQDSGLSEPFFEMVLNRLDSFGYVLDVVNDTWAISFATGKVENTIKNECNTSFIPDGLITIAVDMICGEFLFSKKHAGQLNIDGLDFDGVVASIKTGDTTVNFDTPTSDENKFLKLIDFLMNSGRSEFVCYRRMQW